MLFSFMSKGARHKDRVSVHSSLAGIYFQNKFSSVITATPVENSLKQSHCTIRSMMTSVSTTLSTSV